MSARLLVLGAVNRNPGTHGYDVQRELKAWRAETWSQLRSGSIYHALTQLEKEGLLTTEGPEQSPHGPAKTRYTITARGQDELLVLVRRALTSLDQEEFAGGLALMDKLPRDEVIALVRQRRQAHREIEAYLDSLPRESDPETPATHPEIIGSWTAMFRGTAGWLDAFIERLDAGAYRFEGESPRT
ncbi:MAG TPA: PadR family transcriptional regulator [Microbacterium sp.]|nr:PadR family transcriptional regulator [Microbacterium sp.]